MKMRPTVTMLVGLGLLTGLSAPVAAEEGTTMKSLLGTVGIIPPQKDDIPYRERAPLVLPPKATLPAPSAPRSASADPSWPKDPEVTARRRAQAERERPGGIHSDTFRMADRNPELRPGEFGPKGTTSSQVPSSSEGIGIANALRDTREYLMGNPDPAPTQAVPKTPEGEPNRSALTQPPSGYRRTSTGKAVEKDFVGRVDQQESDAHAINWLTRRFHRNDDDE